MRRLKSLLRQSELHVLLFLAGLVLLGWPFLSVLHLRRPSTVLIYLLILWVAAILLLFLISKSCGEVDEEDNRRKGNGENA